MKTPLLFLSLFSSLLLSAAPEWQPSFNDKPVNAGQTAQVDDALPTAPIVVPQAPRKVLVYSATAGFRHWTIPVGKYAIEKMGLSSGAYQAVVSDDLSHFETQALGKYDAVILLNTTGDIFMPNAKKQRADFTDEEWAALKQQHERLVNNLVSYVEQGGGLVGIHAATDACYSHKEFGEMIGGYFYGHPWTGKHKVTIVVEDCQHELNVPAFGDVKDFEVVEEIYQFKDAPYSRERLRVLLHLDPERSDPVNPDKLRRKDNDYPVAWVQKVGEGRVFYSSLGHNPHIYWHPLILKHYLAGIQFATGDLEADTTPSAQVAIPMNSER
jgi:hypothetical protein